MKLFLNPPSPYARKVVVMAHELALFERLEIVPVDPWADPGAMTEVAPLGRVPALLTKDGETIVESTTICEYLIEQAPGGWPGASERLAVLARAGIAQGLTDAAYGAVIETRRPADRQWPQWIDRQCRAIARTLPTLRIPPAGRFDLGDVSLACGLAYLDFRLDRLGWRDQRPDLAAWLDQVSRRPSMMASRP